MEKVRGLKEFYGMDDPATLKFFEVHGVLDEDHSQKEAEGIASQTSEEHEDAVEAALQAALDAWWGFLDGVNEQRHALASAAD
jgi:pyrroloquinoline quinone (PQQ) biosynthesis protein C